MVDSMQRPPSSGPQKASLPFSYAIGPLDPAQLVTLHTHLSDGEEISLLVPARVPSMFLSHPVFQQGYEWGYIVSDPQEDWTVPKLVNEIYWEFVGLEYDPEQPEGRDSRLWTLGFLLGELAALAQRDRTLVMIGLAHYAFLFSFLSLDPLSCVGLERAHYRHYEAIKAYRRRVRGYREQGKSFAQAQRLALVGCDL